MTKNNNSRQTHVLTVSSGKGGVGKSNLVLNVGIQLARRHRKVLIMDADMGLANMDVLMGKIFRKNLSHVLSGQCTLNEVVQRGPEGIDVLPASSGVEWVTDLSTEQKLALMQKMDALNGQYDILLIDTGAGISSNVVYFNLAAQTRIIIVTPEPTSLTDAYAVIKVLHTNHGQKRFELVINQIDSEKQGLEVYKNLTAVTDRFLDVEIGMLGTVRSDRRVHQSVLNRTALTVLYPESDIAADFDQVARRISQMRADVLDSDLGIFWRQVLEPSHG